jgi:hypothetical protein
MRRREVIRKIGELMSLRMAVNTRGGGLEDTPEFYWSEPELEGGSGGLIPSLGKTLLPRLVRLLMVFA